ncbi:MAG: twin-arginine translocation signal domain-containing protein [Candidatus Hydrogenedentes bacterium]|nr:twin-arginine translocation signal domain-containing protein [Candidatus Hydrogenedentota bacterium]
MNGNVNRRDFLHTVGVAAGAAALGANAAAQQEGGAMAGHGATDGLIWANLVHLSYNMWGDREPTPEDKRSEYWAAKPYLRFDDSLWNDILKKMAEVGMNMIVVDVGDGVQYTSHPEVSVENAWPRARVKEELAKARDLGLEPIPKLNFSACHDEWLGPYARCLSTDAYYTVCRDVIAEVIDMFDGPRLFHLGMDEETAQHQRAFQYVVIRQFDLWWHDLNIYIEACEKGGARPWVWSDYLWHHPDMFFENMPKSVLQSNWYYGAEFKPDIDYVKAYHLLEEHGYDQLPTGSNWSNAENFEKTAVYCRNVIPAPRLKGFLQTPWKPTLEACRERHIQAIEQVGRAIAAAKGAA